MRYIFIILLLVSVHWSQKLIGQEQFPLSTLITVEGKEIKIEDKLTKLTVIDLWATWCKPCIKETPYLEEIKKQYGDNIDIIYISLDTNKDRWLQYVKKKKNTENQFWVPQNSPILAFISETTEMGGVTSTSWSIPKFFLVDATAKKVSRFCPLPSSGRLQGLIDKNL
ncbi:TlpA family protein disulfide reductase [Aquimarina sp. AD1]|uniref:TlpA family protein disulfide reductase n=1 Tax=Aquimarina sp. (strain AD1) TaxID=1714848 RepID=UPI000E4C5B19|nr:TlpA disulfide reductase family protein [Aquimarina sp. AD1]AXT58351.1 TlpA family protein disulfide reductase [Aquimarina sp. AD1]RKN24671.1 TlpA family protein disulfide reductase [Aquimarina sp. AD1]